MPLFLLGSVLVYQFCTQLFFKLVYIFRVRLGPLAFLGRALWLGQARGRALRSEVYLAGIREISRPRRHPPNVSLQGISDFRTKLEIEIEKLPRPPRLEDLLYSPRQYFYHCLVEIY